MTALPRTESEAAAAIRAGGIAAVERTTAAYLSGVLADIDVLVVPTMLTPAPPAADMRTESTIAMPSFTGIWNAGALPACATPVGFGSTGLPLSMPIVGRPFAEATAWRVADADQQVTDWHLDAPAATVSA